MVVRSALEPSRTYLRRAKAAGVTRLLGEDCGEDRLVAALFGGPPRVRPAPLMPDFAELHKQRQLHPHLTQQLLWEEHRQANPNDYRYSRFCELSALAPQARCSAAPGTQGQLEAVRQLCGTTIPIYFPGGDPMQQAHLFVTVLGASSDTDAEVTLSALPNTVRVPTKRNWSAEAGIRAAAPFSASGILPSLRFGQVSLDEAEHFLHH